MIVFWINLWEKLESTVTNICNLIQNGIEHTASNIVTTVQTKFEEAVQFIKNLKNSSFEWGADMINGIVNGIKSCIGNVKGAVTEVADTIRSFLHFSVPDEGPLTDYESWMPDFMEGLARGIEQSRNMVRKAIENVSTDMMIQPKVSEVENTQNSGSSMKSTDLRELVDMIREVVIDNKNEENNIVIPVYVGGTLLDEVVVSAQTRQNLRSGGR